MTDGFLVTVQSAASAAAKLTPAQHRAMLAGRIGNGIDRGRGYWPLWSALNRKRLFTRANGRDVLTDFGRAVQWELMEQERELSR